MSTYEAAWGMGGKAPPDSRPTWSVPRPPGRRRRWRRKRVILPLLAGWLLVGQLGTDASVQREYDITRVALPTTLLGLVREQPDLEAELLRTADQQDLPENSEASVAVFGSGSEMITVMAIRPPAPTEERQYDAEVAGFQRSLSKSVAFELNMEWYPAGNLGGKMSCTEWSGAFLCLALDAGSIVMVSLTDGPDALDQVQAAREPR